MKNLPKMTANLKSDEIYSTIKNVVIELEDFTITVKPKKNFYYIADIIKVIDRINFKDTYFRSILIHKFKNHIK